MTTTSKAMVAQGAIEREAEGGLFDRAFRRYMVAREARARIIAYQHLAQMSDQRLMDLGFEPAEIRRLRAQSGASPYSWG